jgi:hypothetical protein
MSSHYIFIVTVSQVYELHDAWYRLASTEILVPLAFVFNLLFYCVFHFRPKKQRHLFIFA